MLITSRVVCPQIFRSLCSPRNSQSLPMGFHASSKSKRYRGPSSNHTTSNVFSAAAIARRKIFEAGQRASRPQCEFRFVTSLGRHPVFNFKPLDLSPDELASAQALSDPPAGEDADWEMADDVLNGTQPLNLSHEGGEFEAISELYQDMVKRCVCTYDSTLSPLLTARLWFRVIESNGASTAPTATVKRIAVGISTGKSAR